MDHGFELVHRAFRYAISIVSRLELQFEKKIKSVIEGKFIKAQRPTAQLKLYTIFYEFRYSTKQVRTRI